MAITNLQIYLVKLNGIISTLKTATEKQKSGHITTPMAENYNLVLEGIKADFPDISSHLPNKITSKGTFASMGVADITYLDLEIYCNTIIGILGIVGK
jgi:hypothetical protein